MKSNKKYSLVILSLLIISCLTTCKKYPENTLWFKNPKNIGFMEGHLTHYIVNGIDSISYLNNYFYPDIFNNPYTHVFADLEAHSFDKDKGCYELSFDKPADYAAISNVISGVRFCYVDKGKRIKLSGTSNIIKSYKKNIFISDDIKWDILYLNKKNKKRKMSGFYNGRKYELQFN